MDKREKYLHDIFLKTLKHDEKNYSIYATKNKQAYRKQNEEEKALKGPFIIDRDRILYSGAYRRYQGKTQVIYFSNLFDEEMSNRSLHTTYVSQVSRIIGKILNLNMELIEAIALGHDLGHPPFGHDGEEILSECCQKYNIGDFHHNLESLNIVDNISNRGNGLNLTFQVRDGIISHNGEAHEEKITPQNDKNEEDIKKYINMMKKKKVATVPATLEGCVVRISDTIAYIGQDIEDAIRLGFLERKELPKMAVKILGNSNVQIANNLIKSTIFNSYERNYIAIDKETSQALYELKKFNYARYYNHPIIKREKTAIQKSMHLLFDKYMKDLKKGREQSKIFTQFLNRKSDSYINNFNYAEKVRDFIATMTDRYFNQEVKDFILPGRAK